MPRVLTGPPPRKVSSRVADPHPVDIGRLWYGDSPRAAEDAEHIDRLVETEAELPPILVHRATLRVIDGIHRLKAARRRGDNKIAVLYFEGNEEEAFVRAVQENVAHGLPLTLAERKAAAGRILCAYAALSDRTIAAYTGLAAKTVARLRDRSSADLPQANSRVGADRRLYPLDASEGRLRAAQVIAERPETPLREVARLAGVSLATAHDVRKRVRNGEDPLPRGRPGRRQREVSAPPGGDGEAGAAPLDCEAEMMLRNLRKDPALRYSEVGRALLRLLIARAVTPEDFSRLTDAVPAHQAQSVAQIARQCAKSWEMFARKLENRGACPTRRRSA
ncbi:ParB N-terminal domain-containing protein [Nonomuraea sp. NN258]|nr:ParB N-terminal domain-containing protein [Nonomuraea antri]